MAQLFGGWHAIRGVETHTTVRDGLMYGIVSASLIVIAYVRSEINGGQTFFEWGMPADMWGDYTKRILAIEPISSRGDRRRTAKYLVKSAAGTANELTPELRAYVARNGGE